MLQKAHFTQFLRNRPQTTSAIQSNTSFYRPIIFGKYPIQYILEGDQEKPRASIILNPNEQWYQSPAEALQCALTRITGTADKDLAKEIIDRAISAMPMANGKEHNTNVVYQSLSDCGPKDSLEAKLCAQYLSRLEKSDMMCQIEFNMKCAIKLLRLHNETTEALASYRRKGEQKVVVQQLM
jgi:hypothetical protein